MAAYEVHTDRSGIDRMRDLRRRLSLALGSLALTVLVSAIVFMVISPQEDSTLTERAFRGLWETLNLVSTVGNLDELSQLEQAWALVVIIFGLGAVLYGFGSLQALLHGGEMGRLYERRKMKRTLDDMQNHIIVCGYGGVGKAVTSDLQRRKRSVVVIDHSRESTEDADRDGIPAVLGEGAAEETLRAAGVERARGLVAALDTDEANVYLILFARAMNPKLRIVARAERPETRTILMRAGADRAIAPGEIAAMQLSHLMLRPIASEFIAAAGQGEYDFAELPLMDHPSLAGKSLRQLDLPRRAEAIVISIVKADGRQDFNPHGDHVLDENDTLIVVCREGGLERIAQLDATETAAGSA